MRWPLRLSNEINPIRVYLIRRKTHRRRAQKRDRRRCDAVERLAQGPRRPENAAFATDFAVRSLLELPMPTFLLSPLVKWSLAALGGAMIVHWAIKEARRINEELEQAGRVKAKITDAENRPTLRRDPITGEYRL